MKAEELDRLFDHGEEDILPHLDLAQAVRPGHAAKRVNVDFPQWMLARLDLEADWLGVPRLYRFEGSRHDFIRRVRKESGR